MDALQFCYYLKGVLECSKNSGSGVGLEIIEKELSKVLTQGCGVSKSASEANIPVTGPNYQRFDDGRFS